MLMVVLYPFKYKTLVLVYNKESGVTATCFLVLRQCLIPQPPCWRWLCKHH